MYLLYKSQIRIVLCTIAVLSSFFLSTSCSQKEPIKIGFIGGLSGKFSDLGTSTRNGALLAVEIANNADGINGHKVILVEQDDHQDNQKSITAMENLINQKVVATLGPATSSIATAVTPIATKNSHLLIGTTVTTSKLTGLDDYFIRLIGDTSYYGKASAQFHYKNQKVRRVALALDVANADYTQTWANAYIQEFSRLGGVVVHLEQFRSNDPTDHKAIATRLLAKSPSFIVTVSSSVDSALIAQRVKALSPEVRLAGSAWAATERLIELGGSGVEGMILEQPFNRFDMSLKYLRFVKLYRERFKSEPGYGAVTAFDAANVLLESLRKNSDAKKIKETIISTRSFEGVQNRLVFDDFGDIERAYHFSIVKNGNFAELN